MRAFAAKRSSRNKPWVQPSKLVSVGTLPLVVVFSGTDAGVEIASALAREARQKAEENRIFYQERVRAIWFQDPVWWDFQMYDWMESELGLTIPMDLFGYYAHEGRDLDESLLLEYPQNGPQDGAEAQEPEDVRYLGLRVEETADVAED